MQSKSLLAAVVAALALPSIAVEGVTDEAGNVTYDLANVYEPFLTKTDTLIWSNRNLADIFAMTATNDGSWMSATPAKGYFYNRTTNSVMVQLQANDGMCKTVRAYFTQKGNDIYGRADATAGVDAGLEYSEISSERFNQPLATNPTEAGYGSFCLSAFGDEAGSVAALPESAPSITVNGGTLRVDAAADAVVTNALAGSGGFLFKGTVDDIARDKTYAWPTTTAKTMVENASIYDIEIIGGVLRGGWLGERPNGLPFNVTTNAATQTITVQIQSEGNGENWQRKAVAFEMKQNGPDVTIKGLFAAQAGDGQPLGSDAELWRKNVAVPVAGSAGADGYGIQQLNFKLHGLPRVALSGVKTFEGGLVVDHACVEVTSSVLTRGARCRIRNGGCLVYDVSGEWNAYSHNYDVEQNCKLILKAWLASYYDEVSVDAGTLEIGNESNYLLTMKMRNGALMTGTKVRAGLYRNSTWTFGGEEENQIRPQIGLCGKASVILTVDAKGPVAFLGGVTKDDGCASFRKTGSDTLRIASVPWNITSSFFAAGGKIQAEANVTAGTLVVEGSTEIAVADGVKLAFGDSSAETWPITGTDALLNFTGDFPAGTQKVRFGTNASALTSRQIRRIRINGMRARLDEEGYLQVGNSGLLLFFR